MSGEREDLARGLSVYVHVPFCRSVCPYCAFRVLPVRGARDPRLGEIVDLLLRETELWRRSEAFAGRGPLRSVYLGGGTPSLLAAEGTLALLGALDAAFGLAGGEPAEITLEVEPGAYRPEDLAALAAAGVRRFSVGVQSLDDGELRSLGRAHDAAAARRALADARAALSGAPAADGPPGSAAAAGVLSADVLFALPGQTEASFSRTLDGVLALGPDHLSAYELTLEPSTPFERAHRTGKLALPEEEAAADLFRCAHRRLTEAGFVHYEVSSYARPGRESRHNWGYWSGRDVLALGPSAAGRRGAVRWRNHASWAAYGASLRRGRLPWEGWESLTPAEEALERAFLGLRTRLGWRPPASLAGADLPDWEAAGLLSREEGVWRLTPEGWLVSDELAALVGHRLPPP